MKVKPETKLFARSCFVGLWAIMIVKVCIDLLIWMNGLLKGAIGWMALVALFIAVSKIYRETNKDGDERSL